MSRCGRPLVLHVVFRLDYGGLENGLTNLLNRLPTDRYRHCVVALTEVTSFAGRIRRDDVDVVALGKRPGWDLRCYARLYALIRKLRPAMIHTRNWGTLDCALVALLAGVPIRIHGEHGWDVHDPDGKRRKYRVARRLLSFAIHRFVAVSEDLERWLLEACRIPRVKVRRICNGVDVERFCARSEADVGTRQKLPFPPSAIVVGTVTRFMEIKDPLTLVSAFLLAAPTVLGLGIDLRLVMIGDGPLRRESLRMLEQAGMSEKAWLPGSRDDVASLLRSLDIFALTSLREGISNTLLEAMATGLPLVATDTGGNRELVVDGVNGYLVPVATPAAVAQAIVKISCDPQLRARLSERSRDRAVRTYSISGMVAAYDALYSESLPAMGSPG